MFTQKLRKQKIVQRNHAFRINTLSILFLIISLPCKSQTTCSQKICASLEYQGCTLCYKVCSPTSDTHLEKQQQQFVFESCRQRQCSKYEQSTKGSCSVFSQLNQSQCLNTCCQRDSEKFDIFAYEQCKSYNEDKVNSSESSKVIIASTTIGALIICLMWALCSKLRLCDKICKCIKPEAHSSFSIHHDNNAVDNNQSHDNTYPHYNSNYLQSINVSSRVKRNNSKSIFSLLHSREWIPYQPQGQSQQRCCCICLQYQTNCVSSCHHSFHLQCLILWFRKKLLCPYCTSKKYNPITIICQKCSVYSLPVEIDTLSMRLLSKAKLICKQCHQKTEEEDQLKKKQQKLNETNTSLNNNQ